MREHYDPRYGHQRERRAARERGVIEVPRLDAGGIEAAAAAVEARLSSGHPQD